MIHVIFEFQHFAKPKVKSVNNLSTNSAARHLLIKRKSIQRLKTISCASIVYKDLVESTSQREYKGQRIRVVDRTDD